MFVEGGSRTLLRILAIDARRETEDILLREACPLWVTDVVINKNQPKYIKIPFFLLPHPSSGIKPLRKDKLSASDMLQIRKVIEHVYEKMMSPSDSGSQNPSAPPSTATQSNSDPDKNRLMDEDSSAEEKVELLCQDLILDPNMDLRTVRHFIWKSGTDLVLHYRPLK